MNAKKMALAGTGLVAAGIGLSVVGAALIAPAVAAWAAGLFDKSAERFGSRLEDASRKIGAVAGTLHRSFNDAKAGIAQINRTRAR
jgi:hypothetical protein